MNYKILVVDDEPANLRMLERLFRDEYDVVTAESGEEALETLNHHDVAIIISDQRMPGMKGIDFLRKAAEARPQTVRIILTGYTDVNDLVNAINSGVIYRYLTKPWVNTDLRQTVQRAVQHYEATKKQHLISLENDRIEARLQTTVEGFVNAAREIIAQKHSNLAEHCRRTSEYAACIGEYLRLGPDEMRDLMYAALLHELPNIRMPFDLAISKTALTPEQYRVTRINYEKGLRLIASIPDLHDVVTAISYQHERFDGSGFFDGLDGDNIPLSSRILAVASAFDEIHSGRNPSLMCTDDEAADWLQSRAGVDFDPQIVDICLKKNLAEGRAMASDTRTMQNPLPSGNIGRLVTAHGF